MPELPDLEIIRKVLAGHIVDVPITSARILRPLVVRNLLGTDPEETLPGLSITEVARRGKFLLMTLDNATIVAIHPMLAGRLRLGSPLARNRKRDALTIQFDDGQELRYHDARDMGKIYLVNNLSRVPTFDDLGPDADDPGLTLEVFRGRINKRRGEIKGVLVNQSFIAGIGNAYADEILWRAGIYPFRHRPKLSDDEIVTLYESMDAVLCEAIDILTDRVGQRIEVEVRDFLAVHGKKGQPCPRCGSPISEVRKARSATNFCRTCQPGLMVSPNRQL